MRNVSVWSLWLLSAALAGCSGDAGKDPLLGDEGLATRAPRITTIVPADVATNISVNTTSIVAAFSERVAPIAGSASFAVTCTAPCTAPSGTAALDAAGVNATFTFAAGTVLAPLSRYNIAIGGYHSVANSLPLEAPFASSFTTGTIPDTTRPTVTVTLPATAVPGPVGVGTNTAISAMFSEEMAPTSVSAVSVTLTCTAPCTTPAGTASYVAGSRTAVFTPAAALTPNSAYTATITTAATDLAGNALATPYVWRFTTASGADAIAPTVSSTSPQPNAAGAPTNIVVTASFTEAMNPATITAATFSLACPVGSAITGTVAYASSGSLATFTPAATLPANTICTATVGTGVRDASANAMTAPFIWRFTTATTGDVTAPTVSSTRPVTNQAGVPINTLVAATFGEAMNPLTLTTATFVLACPAGTPVTGTVAYAVNGNEATFSPAAALPAGTVCSASLSTGARDAAGNPLAAPYTWGFTTGVLADTTAPMASAVRPLGNESGVSPNTLVMASFSEPMNPLTVSNSSFTVNCPAGTPVTGTVSYTSNGNVATFTPTAALPSSTLCAAAISPAATDVASNALAPPFSWTFTTGVTPDTTAPTVRVTNPAAAATGVPTNTHVVANFSEPMSAVSLTNASFRLECPAGTPVTGSVGYAVNGNEATFTPAADLPASTACAAMLTTAVRDDAGNALASPFTWNFTTGLAPDNTVPTVLSSNPANGTSGVCVNKTVGVRFSEAMDPLTITTATFKLATTAGAAVTGVVAYDGQTNTATFNPTTDLIGTPATGYTVTLVGGSAGMKDLAGNALLSDNVTAFTTNASTCAVVPPMGAAASFGAFGGLSTLTNDGLNTVINGDVGVGAASTTITGLHDSGGNVYTITPTNNGAVNGLVYTLTAPPGSVAGDAVANARVAANNAFVAISSGNLPGGIDVSSLAQCPSCGGAGGGPDELAGRVLPPGIYLSASGAYDIGGPGRTVGSLVLDAGGDPDAVWVFQTAAGTGTLNVGLTGPATPAVPIQVQLINGARPTNVFWYVPGGAVIGTGSTVAGTLLADASITFSTTGSPPNAVTTTLNGRAIALSAGTTMTNTVINVPAP